MVKHFLPAFLILLLFPVVFSATIQGDVYEWYSLEKLADVVIDINTVPAQRAVSQGSYSFDVSQGIYLIKAVYYEQGKIVYSAEETVIVSSDGNFTLDLLLFPPLNGFDDLNQPELSTDFDQNVSKSASLGSQPITQAVRDYTLIIQILLLVIAIIILSSLFLFYRKRSRKQKPTVAEEQKQLVGTAVVEKTETAETEKKEEKAGKEEKKSDGNELDRDAKKILEILQKQGGRITQLDLRKQIEDFGEAKTSLVLTELEDLGFIRKIKKGRGNVIILKR